MPEADKCCSEPKCEIDGADNERVGNQKIPPDRGAKECESDKGENDERNALLENLKLRHAPLIGADSIGGDLKHVFEKSDAPRRENDQPERLLLELQCPYQARFMKVLEIVSRMIVFILT